jgi:hypothetical protein
MSKAVGMKERIKRVLNFRKPSRIIAAAAMALVAVLSVGFVVNQAESVRRTFPMQGINLSDLQTDYNVDDFIRENPSTPGLGKEEAKTIINDNYSGAIWTAVGIEWWENADGSPQREALDAIGESCYLYISDSGAYIAVGKKYGTVYEYDSNAQEFINPLQKPQATSLQKVQPTPSIRVAIEDRILDADAVEELVYEDTHYKYSLTSIRSDSITLTFEDGKQLLLKDALSQEKISIEDLILNGLHVIIEPKDNPMGGSFNYYPFGEWSLNDYNLFPSNRFMYMAAEPGSGFSAYFAFDELIELIEMHGYKEQADRIREAYSVWSYRYVIVGIEYVKDSHLEALGMKADIGWEANHVHAPVRFSFTS